MRCSLLARWLGISVVTSLLTCGCQHCGPSCTSCQRCGPSCPPSCGTTAAAAPAVCQWTKSTPAVASDSSPIVHTVAKPALPMTGAAPQPAPTVAADKPAMAPSTANPDPVYAHDPKYHCLVGTLAYSKIQGAWVLRYASIADTDRYGGCVTVVYSGRLNAFKSGQTVRVEGHLIDPDSQQLRPAFQAQSIRPAGQ